MRNLHAPHVNYDFLTGAVQSGNGTILPSNLDGILETNYHFLVLEWKREGEELSKGQRIMLERLATLPNFSVIVVTGYSDENETVIGDFFKFDTNKELKLSGNGKEAFIKKYQQWFNTHRLT